MKSFLVLIFIYSNLQAAIDPNLKAIQTNQQIMMLEQTRQIKISDAMALKNEIKNLDSQKLSLFNYAKKKKASAKLSQIEKEIQELTESQNNLFKIKTK